MLYNLRQAGAPSKLLWTVYCAMMRSVMCYAYSAWCNIGTSIISPLIRFEKRMCKLFDLHASPNLLDFCESSTKKLALKALHIDHPLNIIFDRAAVRYCHRQQATHRKLRAKTRRFKESFIRFA